MLFRSQRFGGEGTGAQAIMPFDWKIGETYTFTVTAAPDGENHTAYTCYCSKKGEAPFRMATFSTLETWGMPYVARIGSFVEDFRRNGASAREVRLAEFSNVRSWQNADGSGEMFTPKAALFTADSNPATTIDAGGVPGGYFLQTGGDTECLHARLGYPIRPLPPAEGGRSVGLKKENGGGK